MYLQKKWGKEDGLKQLKSPLAALDRKISAELAPKHENPNDGEEIKRDDQLNAAQTVDAPIHDTGEKKTMVGEPSTHYEHEQQPERSTRFVAGASGFQQNATPRRTGIKF